MIKIKTAISPNPVTGLTQEIEIVEIAYINFDIQETKVLFRIYALNSAGERINSSTTTYEVWETLSSSVFLTPAGVTINEKNFPIQAEEIDSEGNVIQEAETQEAYQQRIEQMKSEGINQFAFWISPLIPVLQAALNQGKNLINYEK